MRINMDRLSEKIPELESSIIVTLMARFCSCVSEIF
jgi:hypothetical protein